MWGSRDAKGIKVESFLPSRKWARLLLPHLSNVSVRSMFQVARLKTQTLQYGPLHVWEWSIATSRVCHELPLAHTVTFRTGCSYDNIFSWDHWTVLRAIPVCAINTFCERRIHKARKSWVVWKNKLHLRQD